MASVILSKVSKIYPGGVRAVDEVSLDIADREFVVLVGPSGCGKSTTLRMVAGLEEISSGTIRIGERIVNDVAPKDRNIAMVFQNYALYPHMSVYRNMAFGLMLRRKHGLWDNPIGAVVAPARRSEARREREDIDRRVRDAAEMLGITNLLDRKPGQLSGGQRQRVAVGRAIVREPQAYLFDEPLSNLDAKLRVEMRAEIKRLHRRVNTTTIYVTHDQEEAMTLGDRVVVMKDGVIQQQDSPFVTYEHPVNRFVAGFVGTPPMNFLGGVLERLDGHLYFVEQTPGEKGASAANRLKVAARHVERLAARVGSPITLGVRPDQLEPAGGEADQNVLKVRVGVVEPLGERMDVHLSTALHPALTSRIDARRSVQEGSPAVFAVDMNRVHYFSNDGDEPNLTLPS